VSRAPRGAAPLLLAPLLLARAALAAAPAAPPADDDLLEFLGSVDSEEPGWHDYLAGAGDLKGARPPAPPPASATQPAPPPPRKVKDT
jgi:hypothetical protein